MPGRARKIAACLPSAPPVLSPFHPPSPTPPFGMRKTAFLGFFSGIILGCLFGAVMGVGPGGEGRPQQEMLSVNANTGKPQLHIKGKPEIK